MLLGACTKAPGLPGTQNLGSFRLRSTLLDAGCPFEAPAGFEFEATLSANDDYSEVFLTMGDLSESVSFDGQAVSSLRSAVRQVELSCAPESTCSDAILEERLQWVLLSKSQDEALQRATKTAGCPEDIKKVLPLPDVDAGIVAPGPTPRGFDAVRVCGTLVNDVVPQAVEGCGKCQGCQMRYRVTGERR